MKSKGIALEVIDNTEQHFLLTFRKPGRVEISLIGGQIIAHVYDGAKVDMEQESIGMYDGTIGDNNNSWQV